MGFLILFCKSLNERIFTIILISLIFGMTGNNFTYKVLFITTSKGEFDILTIKFKVALKIYTSGKC